MVKYNIYEDSLPKIKFALGGYVMESSVQLDVVQQNPFGLPIPIIAIALIVVIALVAIKVSKKK